MAQSGFTPIQLYRTATASATPSAGNLADGELAINTNDGRLFYKDSGGAVQTIAWRIVPISAGGTGATTASGALTNLGAVAKAGDTMTGALAVVAGTVSAPGLTFSGDTNTGIYSPAADTIAFTEGGVEAMRIDGNGNVGVGTSFPARRFEVVAASSNIPARLGNALGNMDIGGSNGTTVDIDTRSWAMGLQTGGLERMRIDASGNVGIGTSNPQARIDVVNTSASHGIANFTQLNTSFNTDLTLYNAANITSNTLISKRTDGGLWFYQSGASYIAAYTNAVERMRITSTGNVGIGTSNPENILTVAASDTGNSLFNSSAAITLVNTNSDAFGRTANLNFNQGNGALAQRVASISSVYTNFTSSVGGALAFSTNNGSGTVAERMRIDASGNVGIGTSSPGYRLEVRGTAGTIGAVVAAANAGGNAQININSGFNSTVPVYGFWFNGDTGLGNPANQTASIITAGSERMRIDASGNVGIGTSSPASGRALTLNNASNYFGISLQVAGSTQGQIIQESTGNVYFDAGITNTGGSIILRTSNGSERFRVGPAGQFGVGGANYGTSGQVLTSNGAGAAPSWQNAGGTANGLLLNVQVFTSSGTYTRTAGVTRAVVIARGGGGGGSGNYLCGCGNVASNGGNGGTTSFGSHVSAAGGGGATGSGGAGGTGGTGSILAIRGTPGMSGRAGGGEGGGALGQAGQRGGGGGSTGSPAHASGGGQGEFALDYITSGLNATETVTIGAGGAGGTGSPAGTAGSAGGAGYVIIYEYS